MSNEIKLAAKVRAVQSHIGTLPADGYNNHMKFKYITHSAIEAELNKILSDIGLLIIPNVTDYEETQQDKWIRSVVKMQFVAVDCETGYSHPLGEFVGADQDTQGKSLQQAISECCKRFYSKVFHIVDDSKDSDSKSTDTPASKLDEMPASIRERFIKAGFKDRPPVEKFCVERGYDWAKISSALAEYEKGAQAE